VVSFLGRDEYEALVRNTYGAAKDVGVYVTGEAIRAPQALALQVAHRLQEP